MTNTKLVADILQNISVQNVNKALVYITDWTSPLSPNIILRPASLANVKMLSTFFIVIVKLV